MNAVVPTDIAAQIEREHQAAMRALFLTCPGS